MVVEVFNAIFAPAKTPPAVIARLQQATMKAMADETLQNDLRNAGGEPVTGSNPDKAGRFIASEVARWRPIIKATGLKLE
jgi:tripartite-type tricarboxylate transporter receptor subunit TctC